MIWKNKKNDKWIFKVDVATWHAEIIVIQTQISNEDPKMAKTLNYAKFSKD